MFKKFKLLFEKKEIDEDKRDLELEKGDLTAIMIAGFITLFPVMLLVLGFFALIVFLIVKLYS